MAGTSATARKRTMARGSLSFIAPILCGGSRVPEPSRDADVEVIVVCDQQLLDRPRRVDARVRPDEDVFGPRRLEPIDQVLREAAIDIGDGVDAELLAVPPGIGDVDVETVLMGGVPQPAEAGA